MQINPGAGLHNELFSIILCRYFLGRSPGVRYNVPLAEQPSAGEWKDFFWHPASAGGVQLTFCLILNSFWTEICILQ